VSRPAAFYWCCLKLYNPQVKECRVLEAQLETRLTCAIFICNLQDFLLGLQKLGKVRCSEGPVHSSNSIVLAVGCRQAYSSQSSRLTGRSESPQGDWRGISRHYVVTRTPTQVASHAQKHFIRQQTLSKRKRRASLFDITGEDELKPVSCTLMATELPWVILAGRHGLDCECS